MLLCGKLAELLVEGDPIIYRKYVTTSKKGVPMLYTKPTRALYEMLIIALLFYKKLSGKLRDMGFEINPCDF